VIPRELEQLLEPLERFEQIRRRAVRFGDRLADLSYANAYEGPPQAVRSALQATLADARPLDLQYAPFGGATLSRRAVADRLSAGDGLPYAFHDVVLMPGAMPALQLALRVAGPPGGEVLIPTPCWMDYPLYARFAGLVPRLVPPCGPDLELDLAALRAAASSRTRAVLLSHPGNPTGRSRTAALAELARALREIEREHGCELTLISDETHRDFMPDHRTAAAAFERTIVVYSFGKYHLAQGQRLGYAAVSPRHPAGRAVAEEMVRWTRIAAIATPTALMQRAIPRLLGLRHDLGALEAERRRVLDSLHEAGYDTVGSGATMFIYAKTPPRFPDDFALAEHLAGEGVLVLPAPVFHHEGHFRIAVTGASRNLDRALSALRSAHERRPTPRRP
jgi:aspartate aminotransferase